MSNKGFIAHFTKKPDKEGGIVYDYCTRLGYEYKFIFNANDMFKDADTLKYASMCIVWNGHQFNSALAVHLCKNFKIPLVFLEQGMLPQKETFFVDPKGLVGNSILCDDLSWVTKEDMKNLYTQREILRRKFKPKDQGFILVPLQVCSDSQILYNCRYRNMEEFVAHVEALYPNNRIVVRPHPKGRKDGIYSRAENTIDGTFLNQASKSSVVVSITSTCLYEAAVLGIPVLPMGNHPLRDRPLSEVDKVCAGALALTVSRKEGILENVLERFNVKPL